jgi:hypothetical protein
MSELACNLPIVLPMRRLCLLILLVACSHDSRRENPLDPVLTPPVVLLDSRVQDGVVSLRWSVYAGSEELAAYRVVRQVVGTDSSIVLFEFTDRLDTTYIDRSVSTGSELRYWIEVVNRSGLTRASNELVVQPQLPSPLMTVAFDSWNGSAEIRWTRAASGFLSYELRRREPDNNRILILGVIESVSDTLFHDDQIEPDTHYTYQLIIHYASGDVIDESSGSYHPFLETLSLPEQGVITALHIDTEDRVYALYETFSDVVVADMSSGERLRLPQGALADSLNAADLVVHDGNLYLLGRQIRDLGWDFNGAGRIASFDAAGVERFRWPADETRSGLMAISVTLDEHLVVSRVQNASLNANSTLYRLTPDAVLLDSVRVSKPLWWGFAASGSWGAGVFGGQPQSAASNELAWGVRQFLLDSGSFRYGLVARGDPYFIFQTDGSGAFQDQDVDGLPSDVAWTQDGFLIVAHGERANINSSEWGSGEIVARDTPRVRAFNDGVEITRWGDRELGPGRLSNPTSVATDSRGRIYVADRINESDSVVKVYAPVYLNP